MLTTLQNLSYPYLEKNAIKLFRNLLKIIIVNLSKLFFFSYSGYLET